MGKMVNQQGQSIEGANRSHQHSATRLQQMDKHFESTTPSTIIYLSLQPLANLLSQFLQKFNYYKRFVQSTIIELGEDWRIESGLLAQQIINEKNLNNDEFCIFNEFMAGFVRAKIVELQKESQLKVIDQSLSSRDINRMESTQSKQQQQQYEFLRYFCHSFQHNQNSSSNSGGINNYSTKTTTNNDNRKQTEFGNSLTFKTLSLGFYITAGDVWMRVFKKYHKIEVEEAISKIGLNQYNKTQISSGKQDIKYFASLVATQWTIQPEQQLLSLLSPYQHLFTGNNNNNNNSKNNSQHLRKSIKLGSIVVNITQTIINPNNTNNTQHQIAVKQISLCRQFYLQLFLVWLVFNIKKSFNSALFPSSCFIRYCDIIIGSRIFIQKESHMSYYHSIYAQFKLLCDSEWKKLMKDYMVALNDDKQVLGVLVRRIQQQLVSRFNRQLKGKQQQMRKISNNNAEINKFS